MYGAVRYTMNALKGGGWMKELHLLDPDAVTIVGDFAFRPILHGFGMLASARIAKAIVCGGVWTVGDDLTNATTRAEVQRYLPLSDLNEDFKYSGLVSGAEHWTSQHYEAIINYSPRALRVQGDILHNATILMPYAAALRRT
jgi:hypothetical protein